MGFKALVNWCWRKGSRAQGWSGRQQISDREVRGRETICQLPLPVASANKERRYRRAMELDTNYECASAFSSFQKNGLDSHRRCFPIRQIFPIEKGSIKIRYFGRKICSFLRCLWNVILSFLWAAAGMGPNPIYWMETRREVSKWPPEDISWHPVPPAPVPVWTGDIEMSSSPLTSCATQLDRTQSRSA